MSVVNATGDATLGASHFGPDVTRALYALLAVYVALMAHNLSTFPWTLAQLVRSPERVLKPGLTMSVGTVLSLALFTPTGVTDGIQATVRQGWLYVESYGLFNMCMFIGPLLHVAVNATLSLIPLAIRRVPALQKYKIQSNKPPATNSEWIAVTKGTLFNHVVFHWPGMYALYRFMLYADLPWTYASMPHWTTFAWRLAVALVLEDTWEYWGHRAMHHKSLYKFWHKQHHEYTDSFALVGEYSSIPEQMVLGMGFFGCIVLLTHHMGFVWLWMAVRVLESMDVHWQYALPISPNPLHHLLPFYIGARHHNFHHKVFNANYGGTFGYWDASQDTDRMYNVMLRKLRNDTATTETEKLHTKAKAKWGRAVTDEVMGRKAAAAALGTNVEKDIYKGIQSFPYPKSIAVTGSEGMCGQRTLKMLLEGGRTKYIVCMDVLPEPAAFAERARDALATHGATIVYVSADITDRTLLLDQDGPVQTALRNEGGIKVECMLHVAAIVGPFFPKPIFAKVNHIGTLNVIDTCEQAGIRALVDCTSPSTRFDGTDIPGLNEAEVWARNGQDYCCVHEYASTKARGEKAVLQAATTKNMSTCAVGPHQVYGPSDKLFLPAMMRTAESGKLKVMGSGNNLVSFTHEANISHALCLAAGAMVAHAQGTDPDYQGDVDAATVERAARVVGEYFVVTDGDFAGRALNLWDALDDAVTLGGHKSLRMGMNAIMHLPYGLLYTIACLGSVYTAVTGKFVKLSPFTLQMLVIDRYFDVSKAAVLLGYTPVVSFEEGFPHAAKVAAKLVADEKKN